MTNNKEKTSRPNEETDKIAIIVFTLALIFLLSSIALILAHRRFDIDPVWVLLFVPFGLAMTGALVLFHFLSSSASIERDAYKVGGAAAGFLVLFTVFYNLSRQPFLAEAAFYKLYQSSLTNKLSPIVDRYHDISNFNNETMNKIADSALQTLRATFEQLSHGTYTIDADELPTYLMPMIGGAKNSYFATQYVFPEKFWGQYWAQKYFDENVRAIQERHVDLRRIFVVDPADGPPQRKLLEELVEKHIEKGIPIRIIEKFEYLKTHTDDDLRDILIVDGQLSGILLLTKGGSFNRVEFSIDKDTVERRQRNFDRLLASSVSYEDWKKSRK